MSKNTIKLKKYLDIVEEFVANATIIPGMLVEIMSTGKIRPHAGADQDAVPLFALEDELQGKGINDAYAENTPVQVMVAQRGEQVYAILADGQNVAKGDKLVSNGNGMLKKHVVDAGGSTTPWAVYPLQIVGVALEALDLSDSSGGETPGPLGYHKRLKVMVV